MQKMIAKSIPNLANFEGTWIFWALLGRVWTPVALKRDMKFHANPFSYHIAHLLCQDSYFWEGGGLHIPTWETTCFIFVVFFFHLFFSCICFLFCSVVYTLFCHLYFAVFWHIYFVLSSLLCSVVSTLFCRLCCVLSSILCCCIKLNWRPRQS